MTSNAVLLDELSSLKVQHQNEINKLQLELKLTRNEKQTLEDRVSQLYADSYDTMTTHEQETSPRLDDDYAIGLQSQVEKYERMILILNNQNSLIRKASDSISQSLKTEITALMDEKCRREVELMNKCSRLEREVESRKSEVETRRHGSSTTRIQDELLAIVSDDGNDHGLGENSMGKTEAHQNELKNLRKEIAREKRSVLECQAKMRLERASFSGQIETLQKDLLLMRSTVGAVNRSDKEEAVQSLDRIAMMWNRVNESVSNLESVMLELRPRVHAELDGEMGDNHRNQERLLSTLETGLLVHGQLKISLVLIELKLRNNLECLGSKPLMDDTLDNNASIPERLTEIQKDAMGAIQQVEIVLETQFRKLESKSVRQAEMVKRVLDLKEQDIDQIRSRQMSLEHNIQSESCEHKSESSSDLFVSRDIMERLQQEVLGIVERVKEKNRKIVQLEESLAQHKATTDAKRTREQDEKQDRRPATKTRSIQGESREKTVVEDVSDT